MARRARGPAKTLGEVAAVNLNAAGYRPLRAVVRAADVVANLAVLALAYEKGAGAGGDWPTQAEYAAWARISERTAQRQWAEFQKAFPDETSPDRLARRIHQEYRARLLETGAGAALSLPSEGLLA